MASNVSTVDGMGFEEVNQSSYTDMVSGASGYFTNLNVTAISAGNVSTIGSFVEGSKRLQSTLLGSATTNVWGGFIQAGSLLTNSGSLGFVKFGTPYTSASSYYITAAPCGSAPGFEKWYISGVRHISGVNFIGAASTRYDWIAAGI